MPAPPPRSPDRDRPVILGRAARPGSSTATWPAAHDRPDEAGAPVLVADPRRLVRSGVRQLLAATLDLRVAAEATTGDEALRSVRSGRFAVVLVGSGLTGPDALETLARLQYEHDGLRTVFATDGPHAELAVQALDMGATGNADLGGPPDGLLRALRAAVLGERSMTADVAAAVLNRRRSPGAVGLSGREVQVLRLLARELGTAEIAAEIAVTTSTVRTLRQRLREKLGLKTDGALARYAVEHGLL